MRSEGFHIFCVACLPFAAEALIRFWVDPLGGRGIGEVAVALGLAVAAIGCAALVARRGWQKFSAAIAFGLTSWVVLSTGALDLVFSVVEPREPVAMLRAGVLAVSIGVVPALLAAFVLAKVWKLAAIHWTATAALLLFVTGHLALGLASLGSPRRETSRHPDAILIILDTTRADHLSVYGYDRPTTPALERLGAAGRVYERAWSPAPWTPPAHASVFTGFLPAENGCDGAGFHPESPVLAEVLRNAGYATLGVVNNPFLEASFGWSRGFETYRGIWERPGFSAAYLFWLARTGIEDWRLLGDAQTTFAWVRRWWRAHGSHPRFVMVNLIDAHSPYGRGDLASEIFLDDRTRNVADISNDSEDYDSGLLRAQGLELERLVALYDADLLRMDDELGRFFDWLERRGELDPTIIVVTADHGERLGERGLVGHQLKLDEVLLQVPLIVRYPPKVPGERVSSRVQTHGIFGEILALAGVENPAPAVHRLEPIGRQMSPVLVAQTREQSWYLRGLQERNPVFDPTPFAGNWSAASDGRWKLVRSTAGVERLYHLPEDPAEERDLHARYPDRVAELSPWLDALPPYEGDEPDELEFPEESRELLESLGYVN